MKQRIVTGVIAGALFLLLLAIGGIPFMVFIALLAAIGIKEVYEMAKGKQKGIILPLLMSIYVGIGFYEFANRLLVEGIVFIGFTLVIIWTTDSGAYFVGRKIGKHKLAPSISPNKTIEGALGGLVLAVGVALVYQQILPVFDTNITALWIGCVVSVSGQIGDLLESKVKRYYDVKDSGNILPGHGGILDRFDSILLVFTLLFILDILSIY